MISDRIDNSEVVCEGWLTKSPPTTRILRGRWRRRYFILRHSGELPGQYFLYYYTDRNCRTVKGQIDLDQCDQVDAGLRFESRKQKYQHMFTIRTTKRIYYLAAESEEDMNKWVDCVCHVCGLKAFICDDAVTDDGDDISEAATGITEISPPPTPSTIITGGPYIPISECITGKPLTTESELRQFMMMHSPQNKSPAMLQISDHRADSYDMPRTLRPPETAVDCGCTPPPSPDSESVFTDDESAQKVHVSKKPSVNWETFPRPSDSSIEEDGSPGVNSLTIRADRKFAKITGSAPPRPPKPSHLTSANSHNETRPPEDTVTASSRTEDDMYDIPRSHHVLTDQDTLRRAMMGRHCYTNAAPGQMNDTNIFRYDFNTDEMPDSPRSETGSLSFNHSLSYSNQPSPSNSINTQMVPTPPAVNRELKMSQKCSDTSKISPAVFSAYPPNVDRKLKPAQLQKIQEDLKYNDNCNPTLKLCSPPVGSLGRRKQKSGQSPTPQLNQKIMEMGFATTGRMPRRHSSSDDRLAPKDEVPIPQVNNLTYNSRHRAKNDKKKFHEIQYLDLGLDSSDNGSGLMKKSSENVHTPSTATVYKTVDFLKTEAFNRTRIEIEEERSRLCLAAELSPS